MSSRGRHVTEQLCKGPLLRRLRSGAEMRPLLAIGRVAWPVNPGAFRLFLALLVFAHHCSSFGFGKYAVYVFFVLSGYWVHRMWVGRYAHAHHSYVTYLISRAWRLVPAFALANLLTLPLLVAVGVPTATILASGVPHLLFSCLFILGYLQLSYLPVGSAWSLDIEMQYYIVAPALALAAIRLSGSRKLLLMLLGAASVSVASALFAAQPVLLSYLAFFSCGLVSAQLNWRPSGLLATLSGAGIVAIILIITISPLRGMLFGGAHPGPLFAWNPLLNTVCAVLTVPFAIYTTHQESDSADRMMADLSYIVYLFHWAAMQWLFTINGSLLHRLGYTALAWTLVLPASWLIWRFYDRPINAARARWVENRVHANIAAVAREVAAP